MVRQAHATIMPPPPRLRMMPRVAESSGASENDIERNIVRAYTGRTRRLRTALAAVPDAADATRVAGAQ